MKRFFTILFLNIFAAAEPLKGNESGSDKGRRQKIETIKAELSKKQYKDRLDDFDKFIYLFRKAEGSEIAIKTATDGLSDADAKIRMVSVRLLRFLVEIVPKETPLSHVVPLAEKASKDEDMVVRRDTIDLFEKLVEKDLGLLVVEEFFSDNTH